MLRVILTSILFLVALRFVSLIARLLTSGRRSEPRLSEEPQARERRSRARVPHSEAVDVPFTEIPPDSPP